MVHDIEDQFRLVWLKTEEGLKPSKDAFKAHLKGKRIPGFLPRRNIIMNTSK